MVSVRKIWLPTMSATNSDPDLDPESDPDADPDIATFGSDLFEGTFTSFFKGKKS